MDIGPEEAETLKNETMGSDPDVSFLCFSKKCGRKMVVGKKIMLTFAVAFLGNESERPVIINFFTNI